MSSGALGWGLELAERGRLPLPLLRFGIRRLLASRLAKLEAGYNASEFERRLDESPVALVPDLANSQHYELPAEFFGLVLGRHRKYSSAFWPTGVSSLDAAEEAALELTCQRACLADGQRILELGCGWGSLSLFMARRYPRATILAVSNSAPQRQFITRQALPNLEVVTADMNSFSTTERFDRVVSVEMLEHMRNWRQLLARINGWLGPQGRLFVHIFCHRRFAYPFETEGEDNWMGRHFFSGGIMPSYDLLPRLAGGLSIEEHWWLEGRHYEKTAAAWRQLLESRRAEVLAVLRSHYGNDAPRWFERWRLFFLACEELFGYRRGNEWGVGHYRLRV